LVKIDWVNQKFPDLQVIQVPALCSVFVLFSTLASAFLSDALNNRFRSLSPQKSYFIHVTKEKQFSTFVMLALVYSIPITISFLMYSLLYWNVRYSKKNSVGIVIENAPASSDGKLTALFE
jgi:hypothetical protein